MNQLSDFVNRGPTLYQRCQRGSQHLHEDAEGFDVVDLGLEPLGPGHMGARELIDIKWLIYIYIYVQEFQEVIHVFLF